MAARLNPKQDARSREAIKTTQLVKRLQAFAFQEAGDQGEVIDIDPQRLKAIEILLRKSLPDLSAITLSGDDDKPIAFKGIALAPLKPVDAKD